MKTKAGLLLEANDARALEWQDRGALLTNLSNILDSIVDCDAPNAMHAKVAIVEKVIEIVNNIEA